jgi:hypothetical protein
MLVRSKTDFGHCYKFQPVFLFITKQESGLKPLAVKVFKEMAVWVKCYTKAGTIPSFSLGGGV